MWSLESGGNIMIEKMRGEKLHNPCSYSDVIDDQLKKNKIFWKCNVLEVDLA
jgi:hypothetical protein